ncbi:hypothetical protein [Hathewaya massiliensis]|uniref:hypothetical protein n=1 Tax=Hathewaya massiliensis TaxID=1964382 RepID=UPI001157AAA3|nr:hypothetical protein [Hathewaya massiliensis]
MGIYLYFIQLLLVILGAFFALNNNKKYSSARIKLWYGISFSFVITSFLMKLYMLIFSNLNNLYLFKHIYYLNYLGIVMGTLISIFIFLRSNRLKFDYIKFVFFCMFIVYMMFMYGNPIEVKLRGQYGYFMTLATPYYEELFRIIFNGLVILASIYILKTEFKDKLGGVYILTCGVIGMITSILIKNYEVAIILRTFVQLLWILTMNYSIYKLKK